MDFVWVAPGGAAGACSRYGLGGWLVPRLGSTFPFHTLLINVSGSLAIGVLLALLSELVADPAWRLLLAVGLLGGYTTFSSYTFEALGLLEGGDWLLALAYVAGSNGLGLLAVFAGALIARALWHV